MRRRVPSIRVADCPLYGLSPLLLSETFRLPADFAEDWKDRLRKNPADAAVVARYVRRDLGSFDANWSGWVCKDGLLWPPDTVPVDPGQVRAIPWRNAQLQEFERAQRWMVDSSLEDQRRLQVVSEAADSLARAIEALRQR